MADYIPSFRARKSPGEICSRNLDLSSFLVRVDGVVDTVTVTTLDAQNPDTALTISAVAYNEDTRRVSFLESAGTASEKYLLQCTVNLTDGRKYIGFAYQQMRDL